MADVDGLDDEVDDGASVGGGVGAGGADVGAVVGDDGGELLQQAGAIVAEHGEFDGVGLGLGGTGGAGIAWQRRPFDLDSAVRLVEQILHVGTASCVDCDAFAAGDITDDLFTTDGVTTACAVDQQVVLALHLERVRSLAEEDALDRIRHLPERVADDALGRRFHGDGRAWLQFVEHLARGVLAEADACQQLRVGSETILAGDFVEVGLGVFGERHLILAGLAVEQLAANLNGAFALVLVDPVLDFVAGAGGFGEAEPIAAGSVSGLGGDFDDVAVAEFGAERNDAAVDLGADGGVADLGMDGVGEVDGTGVLGQDHDLALGGEGVDLLGIQVDLEGRHELVGVGHLALPFHELADPGEAGFVLGGDIVAGLVLPVGGDAFFGDTMHVLGADLHFKLMAAGRDEGGVEALVSVGPGHADEVLDATGDGRPLGVEQAEDGPTIVFRLADDADGEQVVDLVDRDLLRGELLLDGVEALDARLDAARLAVPSEDLPDVADDGGEEGLIGVAEVFHFGGEFLVGEGVGVAEGEVLKLAAQLAHAKAMRERGVYVERLARDLLPLLRRQMLESAHIVEAVGEFDDDDADVGDHGKEHLADVLGLVVLAVGEFDLVQLGNALDDVRDLLAKELFDLRGGDVGIFDGVVEQAGRDGGGVHLELGQHQRDFQGMHGVRIARGALLPIMLLQTKCPGLADDLEVVAGPVLMHLVEQAGELGIHLRDHGRAGPGEVLRGALPGSSGQIGRGWSDCHTPL